MKAFLRLALAAAAIAGAPYAAAAADLPVRDSAMAPAPLLAVSNWTGFYVGGHLGWGQHDGNLAAFTPFNGFAGFPVRGLDSSGLVGGLQAGYNLQFGAFVVGVEGDFSVANMSARSNLNAPGTFFSSSANWFGTLAPRVE